MSDVVLDASAVLAVLHREAGSASVEPHMFGAFVSSVNLAEVGTRLSDRGIPMAEARAMIERLGVRIIAFDEALAYESAALRRATRSRGLSLGDRACLALARRDGLPVMTADRTWSKLDIGIEIKLIRETP
jgi:PIN domain nuclease of toxin-antitoxin system